MFLKSLWNFPIVVLKVKRERNKTKYRRAKLREQGKGRREEGKKEGWKDGRQVIKLKM